MEQYRFILQPYTGLKSRFECPRCKTKGVFTKYIDSTNGHYLDSNVGKCSREINCNYHYSPKEFFRDNQNFIIPQVGMVRPNVKIKTNYTSYIPPEVFSKSLGHCNNLITFFMSKFGEQITNHLVEKYKIGTSKKWPGATVFWQLDINNKIRTGKIMLYDQKTGKRIKKPYNHITWVHSELKIENYSLNQCFFGEHLINGNNQPVAITESEKSAMIASVYMPQFIWLAAGSISNLTASKLKLLSGRKVILYPDLNAFEKWKGIAMSVSDNCIITVSEYLELNSTKEEKLLGLDIADYLLKYSKNDFSTIYNAT